MTTSASPLLYPTINGARHAFASIEARFAGIIIPGFKSITYGRTRTRVPVYGTNADPLGKTRGFNEYNGECEMYLAEHNFLLKQLQAASQSNGLPGYGDVFFDVFVTYNEGGFDLVQDVLIGCTLDSTDVANTQSPDPLVRKFRLDPIKIIFNRDDDNARPLVAPPTT